MTPSRSRCRARLLSAALAVASVASLPAQIPAPPPPVLGEDWTFPAGAAVTPEPYSGLFEMDASPTNAIIKHRGVTLWWDQLNHVENVYDFGPITTALNSAPAGTMVAFRLKASILSADVTEQNSMAQAIPSWVVTKYNLDPSFVFETIHVDDPNSGDQKNENNIKRYVAPWHPGVQAEFRKLVQALGRSGILEHPKFMAIYLHGMSHSSGEEMGIESSTWTSSAQGLAKATTTATACGFASLEDAIMDCWKKRMTWWSEAAGAYAGKVVWVGAGKINGTTSAYNTTALDTFAVSVGLGRRHGLIEHYFMRALHPDAVGAGQTFNGGYVESLWDATNAPMRDGRYWGDENEENDKYTENGSSGNTALAVRDLAYRSSYFRAAQLGMRFLWTKSSPGTATKNYKDAGPVEYASNVNPTGAADVNAFNPTGGASVPLWFTLVAGKGPATSPDAVAWLRQSKVRSIPGQPASTNWKNLERFLMQRDIAGAMSQPAEFYTMPYVALKPNSDATGNGDGVFNAQDFAEYTARRTDYASSSGSPATPNRKLAFKLDPDFRASLGGQPVEVRVTYFDNNATTWQVDASTAGGLQPLGSITQANPATPTWKTATFTLDAAHGPFTPDAAGMDFYIHVPSSNSNVTVRYVRVVRTTKPALAPTITAHPRSQDMVIGTSASLSVVPKGVGPFTYLWSRNGTPIGSLSPALPGVSGDTTQRLVFANVQAAAAGRYTVTVTDANSLSVTSNAALVQVLDAGLLLDDFEDNEKTYPEWKPDANNAPNNDPTILTSGAAPLSPDGSYYLNTTFNTVNTWKYAKAETGIFGARWDARGASAVRLYVKGSSAYSTLPDGKIKLQIREGTTGERWSYDLSAAVRSGAWQLITAPLGSFVPDGGSTIVNGGTLDLPLVDQVRLYENGSFTSNVTVALDRLEIVGYRQVLDNFEETSAYPTSDPNCLVPYWRPQSGTGTTDNPVIAVSNAAPLSSDGGNYATIAFTGGNTWKYATLDGGTADFGQRWTFNGVDAVRFQLKGNTAYSGLADNSIRLQLREGEGGERWSYNLGNLVKASSNWQTVTIPLSAFTADPGYSSGTPGVLDLELIDQVRFHNANYTSPVTIAIDGLQVIQQ